MTLNVRLVQFRMREWDPLQLNSRIYCGWRFTTFHSTKDAESAQMKNTCDESADKHYHTHIAINRSLWCIANSAWRRSRWRLLHSVDRFSTYFSIWNFNEFRSFRVARQWKFKLENWHQSPLICKSMGLELISHRYCDCLHLFAAEKKRKFSFLPKKWKTIWIYDNRRGLARQENRYLVDEPCVPVWRTCWTDSTFW